MASKPSIPAGPLFEESLNRAKRDGTFDKWKREYISMLERGGLIREYEEIVMKTIENSGILPGDPDVPIPRQIRDQKYAELSEMITKLPLMADLALKSIATVRKNDGFKEKIIHDLTPKTEEGKDGAEKRETLKRSREDESNTKLEENEAKKARID